MNAGQQPPVPDYVVLCSDAMDWKAQAEMLASRGKTMLLIGACDDEFVATLRAKHNLSCHIHDSDNKMLLWDPRQTGFDCHEVADRPKP